MKIDEVTFARLKNAFNREFNRVECYTRRKLTANIKLREEYRSELTRTYNEVTLFLHEIYLNASLETKIEIQNRQFELKTKLKRAFEVIRVSYNFTKQAFELIELNKIKENLDESEIETDEDTLTASEANDTDEETSSQGVHSGKTIETPNLNRTLSLSNIPSPSKQDRLNLFIERENQINFSKMAFEYIGNISRIIKNTFDGDVNQLEAFIASIELANSATEPAQQPTLVKFIKTKLIGEAVEYVPANTANAIDAIAAIRAKAKGDNTQVVMGRLLALRSDKTSMQKFQETAELLAEKLRKSYISDGIPPILANQMTIDKTVEMCRLSARTPLVKSVLASTKFEQPKEVLAKFITEASTENTEVKILSFRNNGNRGNNRGHRGNNRGYFNQNRGYNNNYNNNRGYNNNFNNNFGNYNNGHRGRGRGRGRGNGNFRNFNNDRNNYNDNGRNDRNVRIIQENQQAPTQERGGQNQNVTLRDA